MRFTTLARGVNLSKRVPYGPGDQLDWEQKNCQPLIDTGRALPGWIDVTPEAAELAYEEGEGEALTRIEGSGQGGRIVKSDVQAHLEPGAEPEPEPAFEAPEPIETEDEDGDQ